MEGESSETISFHLDGCVECRRSVDSIESVRADLASDSVWSEPPVGLEDAVVSAIAGADHPGTADNLRPRANGRGRFMGTSIAVIVGSAAAVLVLVVGGFAMLLRTPAPDWEVSMVGDSASLSAGVVAGWNVGEGTRLVLEAADLGPAPDGFVYQLWFSNSSGDMSAGTFTDPSYVELSVGVSRKDFPAVWIALQPIGAVTASSGQAVLWTSDT